jgi:hypothetical protein
MGKMLNETRKNAGDMSGRDKNMIKKGLSSQFKITTLENCQKNAG